MFQYLLIWLDKNWPLILFLLVISITGSWFGVIMGSRRAERRERKRDTINMGAQIWTEIHELERQVRGDIIPGLLELIDSGPRSYIPPQYQTLVRQYSRLIREIIHIKLMIDGYFPAYTEFADSLAQAHNDSLVVMRQTMTDSVEEWTSNTVLLHEPLDHVENTLIRLADEFSKVVFPG